MLDSCTAQLLSILISTTYTTLYVPLPPCLVSPRLTPLDSLPLRPSTDYRYGHPPAPAFLSSPPPQLGETPSAVNAPAHLQAPLHHAPSGPTPTDQAPHSTRTPIPILRSPNHPPNTQRPSESGEHNRPHDDDERFLRVCARRRV